MKKALFLPVCALGLALFGCDADKPAASQAPPPQAPPPPQAAAPAPASAGTLEPFPGVNAPKLTEVTKVKMTTDAGEIDINVYPQAAPNAAKRFIELVNNGFFENTPIFRVVPGFVAQFGINSATKFKPYQENKFMDDPSLFRLLPGTLAFAKAGPNTNSTQIFIDYGNNDRLRGQNFSAFAAISSGLDVATRFVQVGETLNQGALWKDTAEALKAAPLKPTMILKCQVVK